MLRGDAGSGHPISASSSFKFYNPTNFYQVFGKPTLRPEHSGSWQVGAEYSSTKKTYRFGVNFFRNDVVDLIEPVDFGFIMTQAQGQAILLSQGLDPALYPIRTFRLLLIYNNLSNIFTQGVETDLDVKLPRGFAVSGAYTYLDARDKQTGSYLAERMKHQGFLKLAYDDPDHGFRANLRASFFSNWRASSLTNRSLQTDVDSNAFQLVDIFAAKRVNNRFEVYATIENLLNDRDANIGKLDPRGNPLPILRPDAGRLFRAGVRIRFDKGN